MSLKSKLKSIVKTVIGVPLLAYTISCGSPERPDLIKPNYINPEGTVKVLIAEFKPKDYQTTNTIYSCGKWNFIDVIESLNNKDYTECLPSLYALNDWYKRESNKYGKNLDLEIDIIGPFDTERMNYSHQKGESETILKHFRDKLTQNNISNSDYDITTYLYLNDYGTNTEVEFSRDFSAFSNIYSNEIYVNTIYSNRNDVAIDIVIHEIGHQFGARDLYYQNNAPIMISGVNLFLCEIPNGIPEPNKNPLFPQERGCIMCDVIMTDEDRATNSTWIENIHNKMITCDYTAKEFGWLD